jgi:hypothetical protein
LDEEDLILPFPDLSPDAPLLSELQIDRSNEWVTKAPLPPIESLIQIDPSCLPEDVKQHEWLSLQSFANFTNDDSQSISALWTSCFTISKLHLLHLSIYLSMYGIVAMSLNLAILLTERLRQRVLWITNPRSCQLFCDRELCLRADYPEIRLGFFACDDGGNLHSSGVEFGNLASGGAISR